MTNKARVLFLLRYLKEHSDEGKAVSAAQLRAMFRERGEPVAVATLRGDIAALIDAGYDIDVREVNGVATYYKYIDREWTRPELQILVDAVASGQFLTKAKSEQMIQKLRNMAGPSDRDLLAPSIRVDSRVKAPNEQILYIVQAAQDAIRKNKKISFLYYETLPESGRTAKHGGYEYLVSPYALIWKKDRYYLIAHSEKHGSVVHFRLDRMGMPKLRKSDRRPAPDTLKLEDRSGKIFSMYDGPEETVTLRCLPELYDQIIDQFGQDTPATPKPKKLSFQETYTTPNPRMTPIDVTVTVHLSPTFYAWLFQYAGKLTVISPDYVCEQYAERLQQGIDDVLAR